MVRSLILALAAVAATAGGYLYAKGGRPSLPSAPGPEISGLLSDPEAPWWHGHALKERPSSVVVDMVPESEWGSVEKPPPTFPGMPARLGRHLLDPGAVLPAAHPFSGRRVVLVDIRPRTQFRVERIAGSIGLPVREIRAKAASSLPAGAIVVVAGERHPHFEVLSLLRRSGWKEIYFLEGGIAGWKRDGLPLETDSRLADFARELEEEQEGGPADPPLKVPAITSESLKVLLDRKIDLDVIFVGPEDRYREARIPTARRVPPETIDEAFRDVPRDRFVVVYCGCCKGKGGGLSGYAVERLKGLGFVSVLHLDGHLDAWMERGFPVEK